MNETTVEITGLDDLERDLNQLPEAVEKTLKSAADMLRDEYKSVAEFVGAVDSGDFVRGIDEKKLSAYQFAVESDVNYSDVIEHGRHDRPNYPVRKPLEKAVGILDARDFVTEAFEKEIDDALTHGK